MKNDCTVRALAFATGADYHDVAQTLRADGYIPGRRFNLSRWLACAINPAIGDPALVFGHTVSWIGTPAIPGVKRHTPQTFADTYPEGRYILLQARHVCAVVDGRVCMETRRPEGGCVYGAWRFTR